MNKVKGLCIVIFIYIAATAGLFSQTVNQPGRVRTISYDKKVKGAPVADVRIKSMTEVRSGIDGRFLLPVKVAKENLFSYVRIFKSGYELISPTAEELQSKRYSINAGEEREIIMASADILFGQRREIENRIRRTREKEIVAKERQLQSLQEELEKLRGENKNISSLTVRIEEQEKELQKYREAYYSSDEIIRKEAERLSRIDYQEIDSVQAEIVDLLKDGNGREVVDLAYSQLSPEMWKMIKKDPGYIKREMGRKQRELSEDSLLLVNAALQLKNMADGYALIHHNDSAALCLNQRLQLNPDNFVYNIEYGSFVRFYIADYAKAIEVFKHSLIIANKQYGESSSEAATSYNNIGLVYYSLGNYAQALEYYEKSLSIRVKIFGEEYSDVADSYSNIGVVCSSNGNYEIASSIYKNALFTNEMLFSNEKFNIVKYCKGIKTLFNQVYDLRKALRYSEKALLIRKKNYGNDHSDVALSYNNIGAIYFSSGNYAEALSYYEKSLSISMKIFGEVSPNTATSYRNIGVVYNLLDDYTQALNYYEKALSVREKIFGKDHPIVADTYSDIGLIYYLLGNHMQALSYYEKVLTILDKVFGANSNQSKMIRKKISRVKLLAGSHIFTAEIIDGGESSKCRLSGKYICLKIGDWMYGNNRDLSIYYKKIRNKLKTIVLMDRDGNIIEKSFDGDMNVIIGVESVSVERLTKILRRYNEWRSDN